MAIPKYCKACGIKIKEVLGFSGAMELKEGIFCKDCGERIRGENIRKNGFNFG